MLSRRYLFALSLVLVCTVTTAPGEVHAVNSAGPGETVRNAFGPGSAGKANQCRGACGGGCPRTCERTVAYECADDTLLTRVLAYDCGTHQGCRDHDDCLDACIESGADVSTCSQQCDGDIMEKYGLDAASWLMGRGPFDGRTVFEYTRDDRGAPEPRFRCPENSQRQCSGRAGCLAGGEWVEPVFDSYPGAASMRLAGFRAGPACGDTVCRQSADIVVSGEESCPGGKCTRFGMEFDYRNADPGHPLVCTTSTDSEGDFIGDLLKQGADAMESRGSTPDPQSEDGMQALLGVFGKVLASADSPEDVNISITPLDEDGNPIESQRVGSQPADGPPPVPNKVDLPAASGHLFVPMYQLASTMQPGQVKERRVRCTHRDQPVLDTTFRLRGR